MIAEPFTTRASLVCQLDPRFKVVAAGVYAFVVALSGRFETQFAALAFSFGLIFISGIPLKEIAQRALKVNALIFLLWLVLPFSSEGLKFNKISSTKCSGIYHLFCQGNVTIMINASLSNDYNFL